MSQLQIIGADERLAETRGAKILLIGPPGAGKTSQLRTLDPARTLFLDIEAGDLAVRDVPVRTVRVDDWPSLRDIICRVGGPNPSFPDTACYSVMHYNTIGGVFPGAETVDTVFVDSITAASRLAYRWAEQQCGKDVRASYGMLARELVSALQHLQHARSKNIILVAILERALDDFNHPFLRIQIEGQKTGRELPGIVDEIITLDFVDFGDGEPARSFVCTAPNAWNYPAKDRSGRLEQIEEPNLGKLIAKITDPQTSN